MERHLRYASSLLSQATLLLGTLFDPEFVFSGLSFAVVGIALFISTGRVNAQVYDPWFNAGDVTFDSDRYLIPAHEVRGVSQADYRTDTRVALRSDARFVTPSHPVVAQTEQKPTDNSGLPLLPPPTRSAPAPPEPAPATTPAAPPEAAAPAPVLQPAPASQPAPTTVDSGLPVPSPSRNSEPAPPSDRPSPTTGDSGLPVPPPHLNNEVIPTPAAPPTSLSNELKKEDAAAKKKEKPPVPDLAKGILIASNHGDLTFKPGLRIQPRYMFDSGNDNNDFFIRRFRLKGSGSAYGVAKYGVELKIDNEGRFAVSPAARAENAWLDFPVIDDLCYLRAGLYDIPFSRDALTSDSKLLFMDRTLIKEQLTAVGMADNTYGVMLHGRPHCGQFEYAFGIFDNDQFERTTGFPVTPVAAGVRESDQLMPAGRFVWSLWDRMTPPDGYADYMESYIGKGERLEIGINAAHLGDAIIHGAPDTNLDLTGWGIDLFANSGHWTFQTEYDQIIENIAGGADIISDGWYAQVGYLFDPCNPCAEFCVRYEQLDPIIGDRLDWVRIGMNFYIREHNLKIQTDYNIRSHNDLTAALPGGLGLFDENVFEVQLQLDF